MRFSVHVGDRTYRFRDDPLGAFWYSVQYVNDALLVYKHTEKRVSEHAYFAPGLWFIR